MAALTFSAGRSRGRKFTKTACSCIRLYPRLCQSKIDSAATSAREKITRPCSASTLTCAVEMSLTLQTDACARRDSTELFCKHPSQTVFSQNEIDEHTDGSLLARG
ncbi:hypothetical protein DIPPA_62583 [Diplonema papillatum]|nr:hypothetical protein DIPPA_50397 [Diplonema papillatum]KAJ9439332.1 hypothetical protein DIPPA_62583 [Diplonema papillatum]